MQFILDPTFVVQVGVSPCFETLGVISRHYKPKVFLKMSHLTKFAAELVIVMRVQLKI